MVLVRRQLILTLPLAIAAWRRAGAEALSQGLEQFATGGPPCTTDPVVTPAVAPDDTYKPGAPDRRVLVAASRGGTPLALSGTVSGVTCGRIAGARVEAWQADATGRFDMRGFTGRARQTTDTAGAFHFDKVVPGAAAGRPPHIGMRVTVEGRADLWTELFFPGNPGNTSDPRFREALVMRVAPAARGRTAAFDVILDL